MKKNQDKWVIRIQTEQCKYRLELFPSDNYQQVLQFIANKTATPISDFQVYSTNGRKLNVDPKKRLKDVVYLAHGSILSVRFPRAIKNSAPSSRRDFLSADSKISHKEIVSPPKPICYHSPNAKCLKCIESAEKVQNKEKVVSPAKTNDFETQATSCNHGPKAKCLNCLKTEAKPSEKQKIENKIASPPKNNPEQKEMTCKHKPNLICQKCIKKPQKVKRISIFQSESPSKISQSSLLSIPGEEAPQQPLPPLKCHHGEFTKCINCLPADKKKINVQTSKCSHVPEGKCFHCLPAIEKPAHIPFDQYLSLRKGKCSHSQQTSCLNCLPPSNLRLTLDRNCQRHAPYPSGLCSACKPENVTIKVQQYRHVDYVQFMNQKQVQNFIHYWLTEKNSKQMRVGILYGYYAQDPFYKNGIRAIVQALYQPHQYCTQNQFWFLDSEERKENLDIVAQSLGLEKIGIIIASTNTSDTPFTESQARVIARMQQKLAVPHSTGYRLSNYFTVLVRHNKDKTKAIEPQVFMISDQGQALEAANLFIPNNSNRFKLKVKEEKQNEQPMPAVFVGGQPAKQIQVQFLLVKIASGVGKSTKFSILKSNLFPPSSRGPIKSEKLKEYIKQTQSMPSSVRFGDLNFLLFVAESMDLMTAMELGTLVAQEKEADESLCQLLDNLLSKILK